MTTQSTYVPKIKRERLIDMLEYCMSYDDPYHATREDATESLGIIKSMITCAMGNYDAPSPPGEEFCINDFILAVEVAHWWYHDSKLPYAAGRGGRLLFDRYAGIIINEIIRFIKYRLLELLANNDEISEEAFAKVLGVLRDDWNDGIEENTSEERTIAVDRTDMSNLDKYYMVTMWFLLYTCENAREVRLMRQFQRDVRIYEVNHRYRKLGLFTVYND